MQIYKFSQSPKFLYESMQSVYIYRFSQSQNFWCKSMQSVSLYTKILLIKSTDFTRWRSSVTYDTKNITFLRKCMWKWEYQLNIQDLY